MSAGLIERGIYHGLPPLLLEADIIARAGKVESDKALVLEQLLVEGRDSSPGKDIS